MTSGLTTRNVLFWGQYVRNSFEKVTRGREGGRKERFWFVEVSNRTEEEGRSRLAEGVDKHAARGVR